MLEKRILQKNQETRKKTFNPTPSKDETSQRLSAFEDDLERTKSRTPRNQDFEKSWITKMAVILGVIGALISIPKGMKDAIEAIRQKPDTSIDLGKPLTVQYEVQKQILRFNLPMIASNEGNGDDVIDQISAEVHTVPEIDNSLITVNTVEVRDVEKAVQLPVPLPIREAKSLSVNLFLSAPFSEQLLLVNGGKRVELLVILRNHVRVSRTIALILIEIKRRTFWLAEKRESGIPVVSEREAMRYRPPVLSLLMLLLVPGWLSGQRVGDIATGKVVASNNTQLTLAIDPCNKKPETIVFAVPWKRRFLGRKTCPDGSQYDEYQVEQTTQRKRSARAEVGKKAQGATVEQDSQILVLNTTPCDSIEASKYLVFSAPFKVIEGGEASCPSGNRYRKTIVEQQPDSERHTEWMAAVDWAMEDTGSAVDCPQAYVNANASTCILGGGRACISSMAVDAAKHNDCEKSLTLILIPHCHNAAAQAAIATAGKVAVCDYLKSK